MSSIVEKWVAGIDYTGDVVVGQVKFRKTPKLFLRDRHEAAPGLQRALSYGLRFSHDDPRLHDTRDAALNLIIELQLAIIKKRRADIELAEKLITALREVRDAE
ncbi:MAG: hypothetical protein ACYS7Y_11820 [Planctomycetota bacterium]|jgi:hypothetical protein